MNINLQLVGCLLLFLGMSHFSLAQEAQVRGKVTEEGMALPGVSILVKGTTQGTTSDIDGEYKLNVAPSSILVFSFIGYATQEVNVGDRSEINVVMIPDFTTLDDVVVVGYGTVKKSDLTGSVSSVKNEEINAFPAANVMQALSGRASGVQVIRGTNSIQGSNEPLYVIDGFPYTGSNPTIVSNNDIESMEILKDASATAIYGSRGANGVIIITTKRGKAGKTTVDFETSYGVQTIRKKLDLMNAEEYMQFYNEQAVNDNLAPYFSQQEIDNAGEGYDWQDLVFTNAPIKNTNFSVNGGSDKTQFSVSGTVFDQEGIIKGSSYKKYSIRAYFSQNINKMLSLDYGATLTKNSIETRNSSGGNRGGSMIGGAISAPPTLTPYNDDGSYTVLATAYPFISNVLINPLNQMRL